MRLNEGRAYRPVSAKAAITGVMLLAVAFFTTIAAVQTKNFDFRAFYCAGVAARSGADPYRSEPLHSCERKQTDGALAAFTKDVILPAPQPGYDIAAFGLLSQLPFTVATRAWTILLLIVCALTAMLLARLADLPWPVTTAALFMSLVVSSVYLGELIPFCICAIVLAALSARQGKWLWCAVAGACSLVEPHIGLPVCLALLLYAPRTRWALATLFAVLGALTIQAVGVSGALEYVSTVLPAHAASEIASDAQLSLSVILHWLGASDSTALRAGMASYALMVGAGVFTAPYFVRRFGDNAFLVAVPAACSVAGGAFIHVTELAAALPLVFLLLQHNPQDRKSFAFTLFLLAVPWWSLATPMMLGPATGVVLAGIVVTYLAWYYEPKLVVALLTGCATVALAGCLVYWHALSGVPDLGIHPPHAVVTATYPESSWAWLNTEYMSTGSAASWLLRLLSWAGLALCILYGWSRCRDRNVAATTVQLVNKYG